MGKTNYRTLSYILMIESCRHLSTSTKGGSKDQAPIIENSCYQVTCLGLVSAWQWAHIPGLEFSPLFPFHWVFIWNEKKYSQKYTKMHKGNLTLLSPWCFRLPDKAHKYHRLVGVKPRILHESQYFPSKLCFYKWYVFSFKNCFIETNWHTLTAQGCITY